jgi:hypothetical protein
VPRRWTNTPLPPLGSGGEQPDAAPGQLEPARARVLRNALVIGPGAIAQAPDWIKGDTAKNLAGSPVEGHAVCGIFPFAQKGGASADSAGVAFSFNGDDNKVYLHQLGELVTILRTYEAIGAGVTNSSAYTEALPPEITGFEMFGKFYAVPYARESAANRKGLLVFDPAGAGAVTVTKYALVGGTAAVLRFRGISRHRGATILGWGYGSESDVDEPHVLWYSKYGAPDTWVPDTTDQTSGFINVGTLKIPIVACGMSGQYSIIGKESEIFALDGDFSAQFYYRQIGVAHGPVSTVGLAEIGDAAVWMALKGPAISVNGQPVELLSIDRIAKRFLSYMDLTTAWAAHDPDRQRVVWALRRKDDEDGTLVSESFLGELLWWDYVRHAFGVQGLPGQVFSVGLIRGPGQNLVGPTGVVSNLAASGVGKTIATITWTPGDSAPDVTFEVQFRVNGTSTWSAGGTTPPATYSRQLTGLTGSTHYDVRVRQIRNGQLSAFTTATDLFTTAATNLVPNPASPTVDDVNCYIVGPKHYCYVQARWTAFVGDDTRIAFYRHSTSTFINGTPYATADPLTGQVTGPQGELVGSTEYFWLRTESNDGLVLGTEQQCAPFPLVISDL